MKKHLIYILFMCGLIHCSYSAEWSQPILTEEMKSLEVRSFPSRAQQIVNIYLVDDDKWVERLKEAKEEFDIVEEERKKVGDIKTLIPLYWKISMNYDYAPVNRILSSAFILGEFEMSENSEWADFFSARPTRLCDMEYFRRAYMGDKDIYLKQVSTPESDIQHDHYQQSHSSDTTTDGHLSSRATTPPKDDHSSARDAEKLLREANCDIVDSNVMAVLKICNQNGMTHKKISDKFGCSESLVQKFLSEKEPAHKLVTSVHEYYKNGGASLLELLAESEKQKKAAEATTWHFSDLFSWVSRKSTASSRSSNEGTPPNASFSSRATTPPKGDERDECQPLLEQSIKYVQSTDGLRRRHVVVENSNRAPSS